MPKPIRWLSNRPKGNGSAASMNIPNSTANLRRSRPNGVFIPGRWLNSRPRGYLARRQSRAPRDRPTRLQTLPIGPLKRGPGTILGCRGYEKNHSAQAFSGIRSAAISRGARSLRPELWVPTGYVARIRTRSGSLGDLALGCSPAGTHCRIDVA